MNIQGGFALAALLRRVVSPRIHLFGGALDLFSGLFIFLGAASCLLTLNVT
ncbi:hypothetical protein [uncultured Leclercia sp.]|uniref:hypothetical protein n=1 Tax=uncultured Leclercia sp. TaxID=332959 RepID=UPI00259276C3|nr:hypothetical protein [uncultured Leclercia sp.]